MKKVFNSFLLLVLLVFFNSCQLPFQPPRTISYSAIKTTSYIDGVLFEWEPAENATSYIVEYNSQSITTDKTKIFIPMNPDKFSQSCSITITAENSLGKSLSVSKDTYTLGYSSVFNGTVVSSDYNSAVVNIEIEKGFSFSETCKYKFGLNSSDESLTYTSEYNSNVINVAGLETGSSVKADIMFNIEYTDLDGKIVKTENFITSNSVKIESKGFPQIKDVKVTKVVRHGASIEFTPLSDEELHGASKENLQYSIEVTDKAKEEIAKTISLSFNSCNAEITGLSPKTEYTVKVSVYNSNGYKKTGTSEAVQFKTLEPMKTPVIKNVTEARTNSDGHAQTTFEVEFDKHPEDVNSTFKYDIEYYVMKGLQHLENFGKEKAQTYPSSGKIIVNGVNGGNTYKIILNVYDGDDVVSSEVFVMKMKEFDDSVINEKSVLIQDNGCPFDVTKIRANSLTNTITWGMFDLTGYQKGAVLKFDLKRCYADSLCILTLTKTTGLFSADLSGKNYPLASTGTTLLLNSGIKIVTPDKDVLFKTGLYNSVPYNFTSKKVSDLVSSYATSNFIKNEYIYNDCIYIMAQFANSDLDTAYLDREYYIGISFGY